jgi:hypothetical protein
MGHEDIGYDVVDWIHVTNNRVRWWAVVDVIKFRVPVKVRNTLTTRASVIFPRNTLFYGCR